MIAITTARAGSTRMENKCMRELCGIPLVGWTVIQALNCRHVQMMLVVTEDDTIADVAEAYGATAIRHPVNREVDRLGSMAKMKYGLDSTLGPIHDFVGMNVCMPLRKPGDLDKMIETHIAQEARLTISAVPISDRVILYPLGRCKAQRVSEFTRGRYMKRCQGQFVCRRDWFLEWYYSRLYSDSSAPWPSGSEVENVDVYTKWEKWQDVDIDYEVDLKYCEFWMQEKNLNDEENYETYRKRTGQKVQSRTIQRDVPTEENAKGNTFSVL